MNTRFLPALAALATLLVPCLPVHAEDTADLPKGPVFCRYVPERKDDFAWENDLVAFRVYGPALKDSPEHENSGVDCWFKRTAEPIINKWYAGEKKGVSYHEDHGEGYDGYHVGSSRGCGGTGIMHDGKTYIAGVYVSQKIISNDGNSCAFELTYHYPAPLDIDEVKRIDLVAGTPLFRSESTFTKDGKPVKNLAVVIGVTTHDQRAAAVVRQEQGILACWEIIDGKGVGTGVVINDPQRMSRVEEIKVDASDKSVVRAITTTDSDGKTVHYAGFAWEGAGKITSSDEWVKLLSEFHGYPQDQK